MTSNGFSNGLRLAVGTFSALRVPPPAQVNSSSVRWSLLLVPAVGAGVGLVGGGVGWVTWWLVGHFTERTMLMAMVVGWLVVGCLVWATRAMHVDGLADLTDGLGSGQPAESALAVMRDPRIGAFGALALVVVLSVQASAIAVLIERGTVLPLLIAVAIAARAPLAWWTRRGTPQSADGLGRSVVGAFSPAVAAGVLVVWLIGAVAVGMAVNTALVSAIAVVLGVGVATWLRRRAIRRLGALTGDTLGACIEIAATTMLVVLAVAG